MSWPRCNEALRVQCPQEMVSTKTIGLNNHSFGKAPASNKLVFNKTHVDKNQTNLDHASGVVEGRDSADDEVLRFFKGFPAALCILMMTTFKTFTFMFLPIEKHPRVISTYQTNCNLKDPLQNRCWTSQRHRAMFM